ncbi:hypothetical protein HKX48_001609 [Thoreauomyces humboldtii]|nr:hypothetical protein HKX48_001609 [Thoreauomyces humboldtii]
MDDATGHNQRPGITSDSDDLDLLTRRELLVLTPPPSGRKRVRTSMTGHTSDTVLTGRADETPTRRWSSRLSKKLPVAYDEESKSDGGTSPVEAVVKKRKAADMVTSSESDFAASSDGDGADEDVDGMDIENIDSEYEESKVLKTSRRKAKRKKTRGSMTVTASHERTPRQQPRRGKKRVSPRGTVKSKGKGKGGEKSNNGDGNEAEPSVSRRELIPGLSPEELTNVVGEHDYIHHGYGDYEKLCQHSKSFHDAFRKPGLRQQLIDMKNKFSMEERSTDGATSETLVNAFDTDYQRIFGSPLPFKEAFLKIAHATTEQEREACIELLYCPAGHETGINKDDPARCFTSNLMLAARSIVPRDPANNTIQLLLEVVHYCSRNIREDKGVTEVIDAAPASSAPVPQTSKEPPIDLYAAGHFEGYKHGVQITLAMIKKLAEPNIFPMYGDPSYLRGYLQGWTEGQQSMANTTVLIPPIERLKGRLKGRLNGSSWKMEKIVGERKNFPSADSPWMLNPPWMLEVFYIFFPPSTNSPVPVANSMGSCTMAHNRDQNDEAVPGTLSKECAEGSGLCCCSGSFRLRVSLPSVAHVAV